MGTSRWHRRGKIFSCTPQGRAGDSNRQCEFEIESTFDAFLQRASSVIPAPRRWTTWIHSPPNCRFTIVGASRAEDKAIRAYQECSRRRIDPVVESIDPNVTPCTESLDTDVEVADLGAALRCFRNLTIAPRSLNQREALAGDSRAPADGQSVFDTQNTRGSFPLITML